MENIERREKEYRESELRSIRESRQQHISPFIECLREDKKENDVIRKQLDFEELKAAQLKLEAQSAQNWKESIEIALTMNKT
ncbi:hypothetical protein FSP39_012429 [Pinctada imbricata]|uniref:Uncharacterized protein n=1 Tax=Pinctada imbricata TaxID=66713 RepID=A0AA89C7F0_PINIB|nr:hypothetical protein FSP39_012429 [Pinctada imbricata]